MSTSAFILGGTSGLGLELARESSKNSICPIISGRSASPSNQDMYPPMSLTCKIDLTTYGVDMEQQKDFERIVFLKTPSYFFWNSGILLRQPLLLTQPEELEEMTKVHFTGPLQVLQDFHLHSYRPYHLITIASTSSWRMRKNESIYCALKSAKAHFTRNFAGEMFRDDPPGHKVTLVELGGTKTGLFKGTNTDISNFMDASEVAKIIWNQVKSQEKAFVEMQIERGDQGQPIVSYGARMPESP